ncbi:MAG: LPS export ABC transporter periplasmic protein LptC [Burkholderiales bacterium]|nr:LPS export ABC transporter periplasmic protein LptC [Burkholderiales bacterium]
MADPRTSSYRFRLAFLLVFTIILALGSFWVLDVMQRGLEDSLPLSKRTEPDYYVEQFQFVRLAKGGQVRYHLSGERLVHNPQNDTYEIRLPVIKSLRRNQPPVILRAERALADPGTNQVQLFDKVQMDRPASINTKPLHLSSEYLMILPDDDVVKTDRPVTITFGNSILQGSGMFANQGTREFRLSSNVRGTFPPKNPG